MHQPRANGVAVPSRKCQPLPKYACVLWLTLVTSRHISEPLLLRGTDIRVQGGEAHDAGHILFQRRPQDDNLGGSGKLGSEKVVARLPKDAIAAIQQLCTDGLEYELRPVLEPFKVAAPLIFQMKPLNKGRFQLDTESDDFVFATASKKKVAGQTCQGKVFRTLSRW